MMKELKNGVWLLTRKVASKAAVLVSAYIGSFKGALKSYLKSPAKIGWSTLQLIPPYGKMGCLTTNSRSSPRWPVYSQFCATVPVQARVPKNFFWIFSLEPSCRIESAVQFIVYSSRTSLLVTEMCSLFSMA